MNIVERVKNILLQPKTEWPVIAGETTPTAELYTSYIIPLAAIPAVAGFVGLGIVGLPFIGRLGMTTVLTMMVTQFVLALVMVYVLALIIDVLAPNFGGEKNMAQALKVAAYAMTASWVAGVFQVLPMLGILALLGSLYGIYLLYLGLPVLMKAPAEKAVVYTVVVIIAAIVLGVIIGSVNMMFMPTPQITLPR